VDEKILSTQINLIFDREKILLKTKGKTWSIQTENDTQSIIYEHSDTLVNIYAGLQDVDKKETFITHLLYYFFNEKDEVNTFQINQDEYEITSFNSIAALVFFTMLQLGFNDKISSSIKSLADNRMKNFETNVTLVIFLHDIVSAKIEYFDIDMVSSLLYFAKNQRNHFGQSYDDLLNELQLNLANIGYEKIKESISKVNIEINRDKEKLITFFSNNNFDYKYEILLKEIDEYINTNSTIVTSGMIGNMRSFMEDLITDLARKIAANSNEQIPENENMGSMGNNRSYLKSKLELSEKDNQLINKYIDVLHAEGGHSFTANVEYFRLAKNIGIEIGLFLLSKANNLKLLKYQPDF
jgi:hypothetical protein